MGILKISLQYLINIITWAIVGKALLSWFPGGMESKVYAILEDFTQPIEGTIRKIFGRFMTGPLDFTSVIAVVFLMFVSNLIARFL